MEKKTIPPLQHVGIWPRSRGTFLPVTLHFKRRGHFCMWGVHCLRLPLTGCCSAIEGREGFEPPDHLGGGDLWGLLNCSTPQSPSPLLMNGTQITVCPMGVNTHPTHPRPFGVFGVLVCFGVFGVFWCVWCFFCLWRPATHDHARRRLGRPRLPRGPRQKGGRGGAARPRPHGGTFSAASPRAATT